MRKIGLLMAAFLGLILVVDACGQGGFWTGTDPRKIQFKVIDTSTAMKAMPTARAFHAAPKPRTFGLDRIFPKFALPSWPPKVADTTKLDPKKNIFQPNPPKGFNPFDQAKKDKK